MNIKDASLFTPGVVVSNIPGRGHFYTGDFESDDRAAQCAYDAMINQNGLPKTLILDAADGPFRFNGALDIWQSHCRVTSTGGPTIKPGKAYKGALLTTTIRDEVTEKGEDGLIADVVIDHIWIDGENRAMGIKLRHLQLSNIHDMHVKNTDGPGLWLSDYCIENIFSNIILSDECGNDDYPALYISPENTGFIPSGRDIGNITVNSTYFSGIMIHFPGNDALRVNAGGADIPLSRRQRKIQFNGCYFHGHGRLNARPLITLEDAFELAFVGCQMLIWNTAGSIIRLGEKNSMFPVGPVMISHCHFIGQPSEDTEVVAIEIVNVEKNTGVLSAFGNNFGSNDGRLAHAVNWGDEAGVQAAWGANMVHTMQEAHTGVLPTEADISPFKG